MRAVCINLDRRPDRWEAFERACPLPRVERFADAPGERGGWGATLVWLRPADEGGA